MKLVLILAILTLSSLASVDAECANACSGHGFCGEYDMCVCNRNYRGADCSERVCPFGHAFITTPQGDLNSDGDRADNTWKRLSQPIALNGFKINSDTITLAGFLKQTTDEIGATNQHRGEVSPGDMIRIGNQVMEVTECKDSTAIDASGDAVAQFGNNIAYACDKLIVGWGVGDYETTGVNRRFHNRHDTVEFGGRALQDWSGYSIFKYLRTQSRPEGTWEAWPGDFYGSGHHDGAQDEGHFYMECSNRGICDRKTGECECFDGYTGIGCSRLACPENCNGHGTCETIDELRKQEPSLLSFTVQTYKDSQTVHTELNVNTLISPNDYIKIGTHAPMKIQAVAGTTITLYSEFPETLPYGTHAWQVFTYDLWDAHKNTACKCDAMWTGNDCSLRKCPYGDDPLTVVSYDPESEGTGGTAATSSDASNVLYTGYSPYRQAPERQTLEIGSDHHINTGTFTLTFTDEYGDKWTTRPIPTVVRLSQTIKTATGASLKFGNSPGIHKSEISIGDMVRVGREYRIVTKLTYRTASSVVDSSKQYYEEIGFTTPLAVTPTARVAASSSTTGSAGTPVYRVTVAKEIREALKAIPNDRIPDVTVEALTRGGHRFNENATISKVSPYTEITFESAVTKKMINPGDIIRYHDEYRQVVTETTDNTVVTIDKDMRATTFNIVEEEQIIYLQNGFKYDITFEQGCRTHEDCRYNGVDENDSDGPSVTELFEGEGSSAAYCHNGGTCMCSSTFYGDGCTKTGRGTHANAKVTVSGDIQNLECDTTVKMKNGVMQGLTPSAIYLGTVEVTRDSPQKVTLPGSYSTTANGLNIDVGDHVRIENQVRTVTSIGTSATFEVDRPFEEIDTSSQTHIFPAKTPLAIIKELGGVRSICTVTDLRQLTSTHTNCQYEQSTVNQVSACGLFRVSSDTDRPDQANRELVFSVAGSQLMDEREVEIGDRIRFLAGAASTQTLQSGKWNTRTVDSVTYGGFHIVKADGSLSFHDNNQVNSFVVSEPWEANSNWVLAFNDGAGTTEAKSCSGRGICDDSSGECQCFKGYAGVDCSKQNALAL